MKEKREREIDVKEIGVSAAPEELREEVSGLVVRAVAHDVREHADLRQMSRDCLKIVPFVCVSRACLGN